MARIAFCMSLLASLATLGQAPPATVRAANAPLALVRTNASNNWAGYVQGALDHHLFTSIAGDWTVPTASQHTSRRAEYSAVWLGIGGGCINDACSLTDNSLIQVGTEQDVSSGGAASYSAWYELIPGPGLTITSLRVAPGDHVHAAIAETLPEVWTITLRNVTRGTGFSTTLPYSSTFASAEWIVETPVIVGAQSAGFASMPRLSTVSFSGAAADSANPRFTSAQRMVLIDAGGATIATPSAPGYDRASFNVCTYATSCTAP